MSQPILLKVYLEGKLVDIKQFSQDQIVIGNGAEVTLELNDENVAPIHTIIEARDGQYVVSDLGSQQGTYLNGEKVLEEVIQPGDKITVGVFEIEFFIGAPVRKAESAPPPLVKTSVNKKTKKTKAKKKKSVSVKPPLPTEEKPVKVEIEEENNINESEDNDFSDDVTTYKPKTNDKVQIEDIQKESLVAAPPLPQKPFVNKASQQKVENQYYKNPVGGDGAISATSKNRFSKNTFAPTSDVKDVKKIIKPEKGTVVEVAVVWQERVISTHHFKEAGPIYIGSTPKCQIKIPLMGLGLESFHLVDIGQLATVFFPQNVFGEVYTESKSYSLQDVTRSGAVVNLGQYFGYGLKQGEMIRVEIDPNGFCVYVRYVPDTPKPLALPWFDFSSKEMVGVLLALFLTIAMYFIMSFYLPEALDDENLVDEPLRMAKIEFKQRKKKVVVQEPPKPVEKKKVEVKKVEVKQKTEPKKSQPKKRVKVTERKTIKKGKPGKLGAIAPTNNKSNKKVGSIQKGGSIKTGDKKGANAKVVKRKSVNQQGLLGAFGSGGTQKQLKDAASGSGDLFGAANEATGYSGYDSDRPGDNFGSALNEAGSGGKGHNTVGGVGNISTKGKGTGYGGTGTGGLGKKSDVSINVSGGDAEFVGSIDKEAIRRVIRNNKRSITSCYETALRLDNSLSGKVVLSWDIEERGVARNVRIKYKDAGMSSVANCLKNRLSTWRFPEPPEGTVAEVTSYPFVFRN